MSNLNLHVPSNTIMAAGEALLLSSFSKEYGQMSTSEFADIIEKAAACANFYMLYEENEGVRIAVGWIILGFLSPTVAKKYEVQQIALSVAELNSGDMLWVLEACVPFGHGDEVIKLIGQMHENTNELYGLRNKQRHSVKLHR